MTRFSCTICGRDFIAIESSIELSLLCPTCEKIQACEKIQEVQAMKEKAKGIDYVRKEQDLDFEALLSDELALIQTFLIEKNNSYGNSALKPIRIFSKADAIEQINVRIDDKLNRVLQGTEYNGDDTEQDLLGYFILKRIAKRIQG